MLNLCVFLIICFSVNISSLLHYPFLCPHWQLPSFSSVYVSRYCVIFVNILYIRFSRIIPLQFIAVSIWDIQRLSAGQLSSLCFPILQLQGYKFFTIDFCLHISEGLLFFCPYTGLFFSLIPLLYINHNDSGFFYIFFGRHNIQYVNQSHCYLVCSRALGNNVSICAKLLVLLLPDCLLSLCVFLIMADIIHYIF